MSMTRPGGEDGATRFARAVSRRTFLDRTLRGITTGAVALVTTGTIFGGSASARDKCECSPPRGYCENCPSGRTRKKCPPGFTRCQRIDGVYDCPGCVYETGWWVSCTGLGEGMGYRTCADCNVEGDCSTVCGCRSDVICGKCRTAADVRAEMAYAMSGTD